MLPAENAGAWASPLPDPLRGPRRPRRPHHAAADPAPAAAHREFES